MATFSCRLNQLSDVGFIVGLVFALFLGEKVVPLLILTGVLPLLFQAGAWKNVSLPVPPGRMLWPAGLYFGYSLLTYFFFTGLRPDEPRPANPDLELYLIAIAMLALGTLRGLTVSHLSQRFQSIVPWALLASFFVLSGYMFLGIREGCRVKAEAGWPFIPALIFATLSFLSFLDWKHLSANAKRLRYVLLSCSIVVTVAYTSSRGVAVGQAACLVILTGVGLLRRFADHLPNWRGLVVAVVAGLALSVLIGGVSGCGTDDRLQNIFRVLTILSKSEAHASEYPAVSSSVPPRDIAFSGAFQTAQASTAPAADPAAQTPASSAGQKVMETDSSIGVRLEMWEVSVQSFLEAPLFGHGSLYLQHLISERFGAVYQHNHNQYLTWLVTGGLLALALGLCFLAMPWFVSTGLPIQDRLIITLSISLLWGVSMLFDSFFGLKFYTHYYCMLVGVIYALSIDRMKQGRQQVDAKQ